MFALIAINRSLSVSMPLKVLSACAISSSTTLLFCASGEKIYEQARGKRKRHGNARRTVRKNPASLITQKRSMDRYKRMAPLNAANFFVSECEAN